MIRSLLVVFVLVAFSCSGAKNKQDDIPMHTPPADDEVVLPEGPPIIYETPENTNSVENVSNVGESSLGISRTDLETFLSKGPPFALSQVTVEPEKVDGKIQGFRIVAMTVKAISNIGPAIQVNDVITHINGVQQQKPDDYLEAWKSLNQTSAIRVDFVREGTPTHIVWTIK